MRVTNNIAVLTAIICCLQMSYVFAQRNSNIGKYEIETECLGIEMDGSVTLRSWGTGQTKKAALENALKNAVSDVLFKGINKGNPDCYTDPLITEVNAGIKYEDYFNRFFSERTKDYKHYVSGKDERIANKLFRKGTGDSRSLTYSMVVRVLRSKLKEQLIEDGILKK